MKKIFVSAFVFIILLFPVYCRQWPDNPDLLIGSFIEPEDGRFSQGLSFRGEGQRIGAWDEGEVIWTTPLAADGEDVPGLGTVVLEHSGGFRSFYRGIACRPDLGDHINAGDWVGYAGGDTWTFGIVDTERDRIIDPLTSLPARLGPPAPGISSLSFFRGEQQQEIHDGLILASGLWNASVEPILSADGMPVITEVSLYWVGQRVAGLQFESLAEDGSCVVMETPDEREFDAVFDSSDRILMGEFSLNVGRGLLELRLKDDIGRIVSRSWRIEVRSGG